MSAFRVVKYKFLINRLHQQTEKIDAAEFV